MAITVHTYQLSVKHQLLGDIDVVGDELRITIHTDDYAPDFAYNGDEAYDDLTDEVAAGGGYTSGGIALSSQAVAWDAGTSSWKLTAADIDGLTGISGRWVVLRKYDATDSLSYLIQAWDFAEGVSTDVTIGGVAMTGGVLAGEAP